jgi:GTP-binding protein
LSQHVTRAEGIDNRASRKPLLAVVGRPNVGKSTLFNRLVGSRRAIVGDEPGITRDRLYGLAHWRGHDFRVADTGGIMPAEKDLILAEIFRQARVALEEAAIVVMVVDGRSELAAPDLELARLLRKSGKPLFLAVNKVDSAKQESAAEDFHRLGIRDIFPVSAEHGRGVDELLDAAIDTLRQNNLLPAEDSLRLGSGQAPSSAGSSHRAPDRKAESPPARKWREEGGTIPGSRAADDELRGRHDLVAGDCGPATNAWGPGVAGREPTSNQQPAVDEGRAAEIKVAIIGHPNVGKSTLLNRLAGTERAIVSPVPGTTRDAVDELVRRDGSAFRFIDTAGIRRKGKTHLMAEKLSVVMARKHLEAADIALLVIDATQGVSALDAAIAGYAHESGKSVIILVNKWDLVVSGQKQPVSQSRAARIQEHKRPGDRAAYEQRLRYALKFLNYAPVLFISAALGKGTDEILPALEEVAAERRKRITTGEMNRFLKHIDFERAAVPVRQRVRILYMTQAAVAPPTFVLFTDRQVKLHFSYQRFLENQIRRAFGFVGAPIWIKVRARG